MAIQVLTPQVGEFMGPGYPLSVSTNIIGPIPQTAFWVVNFVSTAPGSQEGPILTQQISAFAAQHALNYVVGDPTYPYQPTDGFQVNVGLGETVRLVVALTNNSVVLDQTSQDVKWDPTGRAYALEQMGGQIQGGFTAQDRAEANITQMSVQVPLPAIESAADIISGISGFFTNPPGWAMSSATHVDLEGFGELTRPGFGRGVNAYGAQLEFITIPLALGRVVGQPDVFYDRIIQLTTIQPGGAAGDWNDQVFDVRMDQTRVLWGAPFPLRLAYSVLPGCIVRLHWLALAPDWWPLP